MFALALREPLFGAGVAEARARIAEKQGRWADALEHIREMRRLLPRDVGVLLRFASIARKAGADDQAEEALRWAILVAPADEEPAGRAGRAAPREGRKAPGGARSRGLHPFLRADSRTRFGWSRRSAAPLDPAVR